MKILLNTLADIELEIFLAKQGKNYDLVEVLEKEKEKIENKLDKENK